MGDKYIVRLKPYDPQNGCVRKTYMVGGAQFKGENGWYEVGGDTVEQLREVRQRENDVKSPLAFDIVPKDEFLRNLETERAKRLVVEAVGPTQIKDIDRGLEVQEPQRVVEEEWGDDLSPLSEEKQGESGKRRPGRPPRRRG